MAQHMSTADRHAEFCGRVRQEWLRAMEDGQLTGSEVRTLHRLITYLPVSGEEVAHCVRRAARELRGGVIDKRLERERRDIQRMYDEWDAEQLPPTPLRRERNGHGGAGGACGEGAYDDAATVTAVAASGR